VIAIYQATDHELGFNGFHGLNFVTTRHSTQHSRPLHSKLSMEGTLRLFGPMT
jgi:hypothetical protein